MRSLCALAVTLFVAACMPQVPAVFSPEGTDPAVAAEMVVVFAPSATPLSSPLTPSMTWPLVDAAVTSVSPVAAPVIVVATQLPTTPTIVITSDYANLRSGPGQSFELVGKLTRGQQALVVARNPESTWWQVAMSANIGSPATTAWVFAELAHVTTAAMVVPVVVTAQRATLSATAIPTPRPVSTSVTLTLATAVVPIAVSVAVDGCNPSNPDWRGQGKGNPEYAFCVRKDLDFKDGDKGGHLELRWDIYGVQSVELRFDGGQRGLRQQVSLAGAYGFYRGEFPGCNKAELYITRKDGKVVGYNERFWCS